MDRAGLSLFNPGQHLEVLHEASLEDDDDDAEERRRIEEEVAQGLEGAFDDLELDLEDDDDDDEEDDQHDSIGERRRIDVTDQMVTPNIAGRADNFATSTQMATPNIARKTDNFATSTPFVNRGLNDSEDQDLMTTQPPPTPREVQFDQFNNKNEEQLYLRAGSRNEELEVLYQARGREINRLNEELQKLRESTETELRLSKHQLTILKGEKENLIVNVEQLQELLNGSNAENKTLRDEIQELKSTLQNTDKSKQELVAQVESSEHMIQSLQSQLMDLQKSDAILKARQQHDAIVRSLKERHENEVYTLQQEVDRLSAKVRRQENEIDDFRNKLMESQRIHEETIVSKSEVISELNRKLEDSQKKITKLMAEDSSQECSNAKYALQSCQNQNNEYKNQIQHLQETIQQLKSELAGYEAVVVNNASNESLIALGIATEKGDQESSAQQIRDALQRSLIGNKTKREEIAKLRRELNEKESLISKSGLKIESLEKEIAQLKEEKSKATDERLHEKEMKIEELRLQLENDQKHFEELILEKAKMITDLNIRLDENQKRVTELLSEKISNKKLEHEIATLEMSLKVCQAEREEFKRLLKTNEAKAEGLRMQLREYERIVSGRRRSDGNPILDQVEDEEEVHQRIRNELQKALNGNAAKKEEIFQLRREIEKLKNEMSRLRKESDQESVREELKEVKAKYQALKKKVRIYQKHCQDKENFYINERQAMEEEYRNTLMALKTKMEQAYRTKEQQVEMELMEMKDHFNAELAKLASLDVNDGDGGGGGVVNGGRGDNATYENEALLENLRQDVAKFIFTTRSETITTPRLSNTPKTGQMCHAVEDLTDDEITTASCEIPFDLPRPKPPTNSTKKSEELAKIFARAQDDIKNKLQRPLANVNL